MFKNKTTIFSIIILFIFFLISVFSIYSASSEYVIKQIIWYLIGTFLIIFLNKKKLYNIITNKIIYVYIFINVILILLLFVGPSINGSKCWFIIPKLGSVQPSEFMKITLIILNSKILSNKNKNKYFNILLVIIITIIPSILTFLEPDTGMVLIYIIISLSMLFIYGLNKKIIIPSIVFLILLISTFLYLYFYKENIFLKIFGTSFYYRINRIFNWSNNSGMQIQNALYSIKASGLKGFGIANNKIYIPEAHTDFIFSIYSSNTGFIGSLFLIICIILFNITLFIKIKTNDDEIYNYIIFGFLIMILFQQIQNISMNIGLLPIMGITLPFISYGGSSLLSYLLLFGLILSYDKDFHKNNR